MTHPVSETALAAFFRGIERRALVFALAQCGDQVRAQAALQASVAGFRQGASEWPIAAWPAQFWSMLLQRPELAQGGSDEPILALLSAGPRAALLLRLVAGLDFSHAAQTLAVSESTYRFALQRGLDQLHAAGHDMPALEALREALRARVETLPASTPPVSEGPGPVEAAPPPADAEVAVKAIDSVSASRPTWHRWAFAALALAFAATFLPLPRHWFSPSPSPADSTPSLPAVRAISDSDAVLHPDFALLQAPQDEALANDLPFLSWVEAGAPKEGESAQPATFADATAPSAEVETGFDALPADWRGWLAPIRALWPQLGAAERRELQAHARYWQGLPAAERESLRTRLRQWDALPATPRAQRRAAFARWHRLGGDEQAALRLAQARYAAMPTAQQQSLRQTFASLPDPLREAWAQGPALGRALPALASLFDFVPGDERERLLEIVRALPMASREALAARLQALPPSERERLRRALMAAKPEDYGQLIGTPTP